MRGQFRVFLRRTATWTAVWGLAAVGLIVLAAPSFSKLLFGTPSQARLVGLVALSLAAVMLQHFLEALLKGLRMFRIVSVMQFAHSLGFAGISLSLLVWWRLGAASIVIGYGAASLISATGALLWLIPSLTKLPPEPEAAPLPQRLFWPKLLRFACWIWLTNLLANVFAVIDRYMIVHYGNFSASEAMTEVGNYHSSRIVPLLLLSVADLLSTVVLPHLTYDWEAGRRDAVRDRLNFVLKATSLLMLAGGTCVLAVAPALFSMLLGGKYDGGLAVLPLTLAYCTFHGIVGVAMTYLWCAERAGLSVIPMGLALILNTVLNIVLVPRFGLAGAVMGTTAANILCLAVTLSLSRRVGMRFDFGTLIVCWLPMALIGGANVAAVALVGTLCVAALTGRIFSELERQQLASFGKSMLARIAVGTNFNRHVARRPRP
jgi:O-antigen/teichoic acid export membrane protein